VPGGGGQPQPVLRAAGEVAGAYGEARLRPKPRPIERPSRHLPEPLVDRSTSAITVAGPEIVGVRLTAAAYAHGLALALPEKVVMARPTGVGHALTVYRMPIEGRDEWIAAVERLA
jgi:hypothetical protein